MSVCIVKCFVPFLSSKQVRNAEYRLELRRLKFPYGKCYEKIIYLVIVVMERRLCK